MTAPPRNRRWTLAIWSLAAICCVSLGVSARSQARGTGAASPQTLTKDQLDFFESKVRPIFTDNCYKCHSPSKGIPKSGLELDWKGGWEKGGSYGPAIVPGDPEKSLLIQAVRYTDSGLQMPPDGKLSTSQVNDLVAWVRMGAPDPRTARPAGNAVTYGGNGKNHWAFKPVAKPAPPAVKNEPWIRNEIDRFVLAKLEANGMTANERADKRALIRRAYYDVIGLPPTPEQVNAFLADNSPNSFEKVVDALLASPRYGERWGRHWLDVARYSDTKGQFDRRREETSVYPYAWTYRDYVIKAFNDDLPYDQFIREQLAADRLEDGQNARKSPGTLAALGFITLGDHFNGNVSDIINDRIDVTSKAFLGLTVTCARCHDHKFDPIPTADYYSLYGIFASSIEPADKPVIAPPNAANAEYLVKRRDMDERIKTMREQNIKDLFGDYRRHGAVYLLAMTMPENQSASYLTKNGADPALLQNWVRLTRPAFRQGSPIFGIWAALSRPPAERFAQQAPRILRNLYREGTCGRTEPDCLQGIRGSVSAKHQRRRGHLRQIVCKDRCRVGSGHVRRPGSCAVSTSCRGRRRTNTGCSASRAICSSLWSPARLPEPTSSLDGPKPKDSPIFIRGQAETPGQVVPRRFLEVLSGTNRPTFRNGSGRLELANAIASKTNPLTARVMVNRVWQHHFGDGFVSTPDDLGQSVLAAHPSGIARLACEPVYGRWLVREETAQADSALCNVAAEQP